MFNFLKILFGSKHERDIRKIQPLVDKVNSYTEEIKKLDDAALRAKTDFFLKELESGKSLDDLLPQAFAVVREACERVFGKTYKDKEYCKEVFGDERPRFGRPFDVQVIGGIVLHQGKIAEMKTGEGKTLAATMPVYLNAMTKKGVHVVTTNSYLAKRDASWMRPVYEFLGLSVDCIDEYTPHSPARRAAYEKDITYGTNNEFGFDYLRDNMVEHKDMKVQKPHSYAIVDEVDSILIDESRTPLIISGPSVDNVSKYYTIDKLIPRLKEAKKDEQGKEIPGTGDFLVDEKDKNIVLTEDGVGKVEKFLNVENLYDTRNIELVHHVHQALKAHKLFKKDVDYIIENGEVVIIDEFTGRKMEGRRFSDGLHQALEAKERVNIASENQTLATITFQNYFRMYDKLAGMTGTADTEAEEFKRIYNLEVTVIPTNVPVVRNDSPDRIYRTEREKFEAIALDAKEKYKNGQPILIGTVSVEKSEDLSKALNKAGLRHNILNAKNHAREALIIEHAGEKGSITIATNMAGRGTDIKLGDGVKEAGGLVIIGSERHESRRIDNQLRGRSGRQGDPGMSRFYLSLEDDLMRLFGSERISNVMSRLGMEEGQEIEHTLISRAIENAQKRVETRNFEIRKHLLEYDDVMNEQRKYIYKERDYILYQDSIIEKIYEIIENVVETQIEAFSEGRRQGNEYLYSNISSWIEGAYNLKFPYKQEEFLKFNYNQILDNIIDFLKKEYDEKENKAYDPKVLRLVEKQVVLQIIDNRWKEHLLNMDHLREGINLRAYGERKPLTEYKHEGFSMFKSMVENMQVEALEILFRIVITRQPEQLSDPAGSALTGTAQHESLSSFSSSSAGPVGKKAPQQQQVILKSKIGRNEPCPCGSGKKYKHCCGTQ